MSVDWNNPNHKKILGIKEIRRLTDAGLKEAKDAIEDVGDRMEDHVSDQQLIYAACNLLDPRRFPAQGSVWDYKTLWDDLKRIALPELVQDMEKMEQEHEKALTKILARNKLAAMVSRILSQKFDQVAGDDTIIAYDSQGNWENFDLNREEFREVFETVLMDWLYKTMKTHAWRS